MKGDFTRDTFKAEKHFQQVLMQQGRVQLDADWNEQAAISSRRDQTTTRDIVGTCGGPIGNAAFGISPLVQRPGDFLLSAGRYYVDGLQCELEADIRFTEQPDRRGVDPLGPGQYLIYLDVWPRHVTMHEDGEIREAALGGPDTATRIKTVWQVRAATLDVPFDVNDMPGDACGQAAAEFDQRQRPQLPRLAARTSLATADTDPCTVPASAGYRGLENQLYRVEIHTPGFFGTATYKWSRENGAVVTRILEHLVVTLKGVNVSQLTVANTGLDDNLAFKKDDVVEIIHESDELEGNPGALAKVDHVDDSRGQITLAQFGSNAMPVLVDLASNPRLRRWEGFGQVTAELGVNDGFLAIEQGIEVQFELPEKAEFRTGDYWQIPARTASPDALAGKIDWPNTGGVANLLPPKGIEHHYCRLGIVLVSDSGTVTAFSDCRDLFPPLTHLTNLYYVSGDGQEMAPHPTEKRWLCGPLRVRVLNGNMPVIGAKVRFAIASPDPPENARLALLDESQQASQIVVGTDATGMAACLWRLDGSETSECQRVTAVLLDRQGSAIEHQRVEFNGRLDAGGLGETDLTRIVAISWQHGGGEADLFPILLPNSEKEAGVGFVIACNNQVTVPSGDHDHVFEVLIPTPPVPSVNPPAGPGGGVPFTVVDPAAQSIYQCWCPLRTGHDAAGRRLARIVPVDCTFDEQKIQKAIQTEGKPGNGIALLLEPGSLTHLLVHQATIFDQFWIRLRCDFVVDERGKGVDGEFLRASLPSGDRPEGSAQGIQGGLFESWFSFRGNFRGGHMVPEIRAAGLTVNVVSFWRKAKAAMPVLFAAIDGGVRLPMAGQLASADIISDPRFDIRLSTHTLALNPSGPQMIDIFWQGLNRISHVPNARLGGFLLRSRIRWQGQSDTNARPIVMDLRQVNLNVQRGRRYEAMLGASSPTNQRLRYDLRLGMNIVDPPPGLEVNADSGLMTIDPASSQKYVDNPRNPGGDMALSGTVRADDGSFVAFEGMFDGIEPA